MCQYVLAAGHTIFSTDDEGPFGDAPDQSQTRVLDFACFHLLPIRVPHATRHIHVEYRPCGERCFCFLLEKETLSASSLCRVLFVLFVRVSFGSVFLRFYFFGSWERFLVMMPPPTISDTPYVNAGSQARSVLLPRCCVF